MTRAASSHERPGPHRLGTAPVADVLVEGEVTVLGRFADSSNATLLVSCALGPTTVQAVYKPVRGERPLWDFPAGLHRREVAAYVLSEELGWDLVPETVLRDDAPFGEGSLQRLVPEDGVSHYFTLRDDAAWHQVLRRLAAFDVVANNADRKSGHVLLADGRLWAIDHGLTFHVEPKLRTVLWDFAGDPLDADVVEGLRRLVEDGPPDALAPLLDADEQAAVVRRAESLLAAGRLPRPRSDRAFPWPLV